MLTLSYCIVMEESKIKCSHLIDSESFRVKTACLCFFFLMYSPMYLFLPSTCSVIPNLIYSVRCFGRLGRKRRWRKRRRQRRRQRRRRRRRRRRRQRRLRRRLRRRKRGHSKYGLYTVVRVIIVWFFTFADKGVGESCAEQKEKRTR